MVGLPELEIIPLSFEGRKVLCTIRKSKRAKRIALRIRSKSEVVLIVPSRGSIAEAKKFLLSKSDWISRKTAVMPENYGLTQYFEGNPRVWIDSSARDLNVSFSDVVQRATYEVAGDLIKVIIPETEKKEDYLLKMMLTLAKIYLPMRLESCAKKVGLTYKKVRVRNQRTRWGSCSSGREISLNWRILLLDYGIGEYVLYHELAHLKHMNHSIKYWNLLSHWVGDARGLDKQLSANGRALMLLGFNK